VELAVDLREVPLDGLGTHQESPGHLAVRLSVRHKFRDVALSCCESAHGITYERSRTVGQPAFEAFDSLPQFAELGEPFVDNELCRREGDHQSIIAVSAGPMYTSASESEISDSL
jgi:hypothetical protein